MTRTMAMQPGMTPEVAVLGAAALDWVAQVQELPQPDSIVYADHYAPMPGGTGGNVAVGIARLGHGVRFLGVLGDDENGKKLLDAFKEAGVDTTAIEIKPGERSASTFIAIDRKGERVIFSLGGVALYEKAGEISPVWFSGIRVLFIADAYPEPALAAIQALAQEAMVIFNPGGLMVSAGIEFLRPILSRAHALIVSHSEARMMTGESDIDRAILRLAESGPSVVMVTLGNQGALLRAHNRLIRIPSVQAEVVIDTTGAGDAFSAGVVSGILHGYTWEEATRFGGVVASLKIAHLGARSGLPGRQQAEALYRTLDITK
ncbi:MAG: carbohydrate kinase family protein [Anaerolineaceae bacterium]|nr:carbohydrate kinase family protein [Anaerolineaceae bacterium]